MKNDFTKGLLVGFILALLPCIITFWILSPISQSSVDVSIKAYNSLNSRVNAIEADIRVLKNDLLQERQTREYGLNNAFKKMYEIEDKIDNLQYQYLNKKEFYDAFANLRNMMDKE